MVVDSMGGVVLAGSSCSESAFSFDSSFFHSGGFVNGGAPHYRILYYEFPVLPNRHKASGRSWWSSSSPINSFYSKIRKCPGRRREVARGRQGPLWSPEEFFCQSGF